MIFAGWRREASLSARRQKLAQDAYAAFFDRSIQYYAAGRFAFHSGLTPVAGNLLHHAVEMCLKGALSKKGFGLKQLYKLGHGLPSIWAEYKHVAPDPGLDRFDAAVTELNKHEELRYPDRMLNQGMGSLFVLKRSHTAHISGSAAGVPQYVLNLEDVDELMSVVLKQDITPPWIGKLKPEARAVLLQENDWPLV
jgi:HEPN domain-containing protein